MESAKLQIITYTLIGAVCGGFANTTIADTSMFERARTSGPVAAQLGQLSVAQSSPSYSDAELKSFAEALLEVQRINNAYQPSLEAATTPEEENRVHQAALNEVTQVLKEKGMSVDKYKEIVIIAQNNSDIAERIMQQIRNVQ